MPRMVVLSHLCLAVFFVLILLLPARGGNNVYKQIYPPVSDSLLSSQDYCDPDSNQTCPLFIAFLSSFGGIYKSNGGIPGVQIALDEINRDSSILPGYSLHYTLKDSNCSRQVALSSLHTQMFQPPTKLGVIGSGCSRATEATAESAHFFNLTQLSCFPPLPSFSSRDVHKSTFQLLSSETNLAYGYFGIVKEFGWKRVAIFTQDKKAFTQVSGVFIKQLQSVNISYRETLFLTARSMDSLNDGLFNQSGHMARVFFLSMYPSLARQVLCKAYQKRVYYPCYQFIIPGWYGERWWVGDNATQRNLMEKYQCSVANREQVLAYSLTVFQDEFLKNNSTVADSGNNGTGFYEEYNRLINSSFNLEPTIYAQQCYDATWTYARALNKTLTDLRENETLRKSLHQFNSGLDPRERFNLQHFTYNNSAMLSLMIDNIANTDFLGLTGNIRFDNNGTKRVQNVIIRQYRNTSENGNLEMVDVADVDFSNTSNLLFSYKEGFSRNTLWPHGMIPYDGVPEMAVATVHISISVIFGLLASVGIAFALICLIFNFYFRNTLLMKLSSKNLNYLIGIGAIMLYVSVFFIVTPVTDGRVYVIFSNIVLWLEAIGYSLCFGTVIMKMTRICYIFYRPLNTSSKKKVQDWMLALGVLVLVFIHVLILISFIIADQNNFNTHLIPSLENSREEKGVRKIIQLNFVHIYETDALNITYTIILSIEVFLQIVALILAFRIRSVKVKGLDDSLYIVTSINITSIIIITTLVVNITLASLLNAIKALVSSGYIIAVTSTLLLMFVPKMVCLYRDPRGENLFESIAPPTEITGERKLSCRGSTFKGSKEKKSDLNRRKTVSASVLPDGTKDDKPEKRLIRFATISPIVHCYQNGAPIVNTPITNTPVKEDVSSISVSEEKSISTDTTTVSTEV